jgi:hypothetical protein
MEFHSFPHLSISWWTHWNTVEYMATLLYVLRLPKLFETSANVIPDLVLDIKEVGLDAHRFLLCPSMVS